MKQGYFRPSVSPRKLTPHMTFAFNALDPVSVRQAYSDAQTACSQVAGAHVVVFGKPKLPGPWQRCPNVGENFAQRVYEEA